jgi:hypothetical protein
LPADSSVESRGEANGLKRMLGDKAYDSAELRDDLHERGTKPVFPNRCNTKQPFSFNERIYKLR